jgi:hypothetical protein
LKHILYFTAIVTVISILGCTGPKQPAGPVVIVPGMSDISESVAALEKHRAGVLPITANADVKIIFFKDGKKKEENPDASLAFAPPKQLFFRAKRLGIEVIWVGSNDEEFWFRMKPKEISQYFWGTWSQLDGCSSNLLISPESMLDALGMVTVDSSWLLIDRQGEDVLVKIGENNYADKMIFIDRNGYLISRIEYNDKIGLIMASVDMSDYRSVGDSTPVPAKINITAYKDGEVTTEIKIKLKNLKYLKPERIGKKLFKRPEPKGFKSIFKMGDNCKFDEQ